MEKKDYRQFITKKSFWKYTDNGTLGKTRCSIAQYIAHHIWKWHSLYIRTVMNYNTSAGYQTTKQIFENDLFTLQNKKHDNFSILKGQLSSICTQYLQASF